jgi:hypothetical protein
MKNYYRFIHEHKHGTDCYVFSSTEKIDELPPLEDCAKLLGIDYDVVDSAEYLNWDEIKITDIDKLIKPQEMTEHSLEGE